MENSQMYKKEASRNLGGHIGKPSTHTQIARASHYAELLPSTRTEVNKRKTPESMTSDSRWAQSSHSGRIPYLVSKSPS